MCPPARRPPPSATPGGWRSSPSPVTQASPSLPLCPRAMRRASAEGGAVTFPRRVRLTPLLPCPPGTAQRNNNSNSHAFPRLSLVLLHSTIDRSPTPAPHSSFTLLSFFVSVCTFLTCSRSWFRRPPHPRASQQPNVTGEPPPAHRPRGRGQQCGGAAFSSRVRWGCGGCRCGLTDPPVSSVWPNRPAPPRPPWPLPYTSTNHLAECPPHSR